jgi:transposase
MKALLTAQQINKTDRNDARGIAQMMRVGLFKPVHVKTLVAQEQRMLLTSRKLLQRKLLDLELELRGTLCNFGLKVGGHSGTAALDLSIQAKPSHQLRYLRDRPGNIHAHHHR